MYFYGKGVKQDYTEAAKWFRKAAAKGRAVDQDQLGFLYYYGYGVKQNDTEAEKWFRKAAEKQNVDALEMLGQYYSRDGEKQDWAEAYFWFSLNLYAQPATTIKQNDEAAKHLTPGQKAAVDKRIAEWKKTHPIPLTRLEVLGKTK
jgi:hypothetical protein